MWIIPAEEEGEEVGRQLEGDALCTRSVAARHAEESLAPV